MSRTCSIALVGLSPAEQALIEAALFPTSGSAIPGTRLEQDLARAQLVIASADDAAAVAALKALALPGRVLLLGGSDRGAGWPFVLRPLRLRAVLDACRQLLERPRVAVEVEAEAEAPERGWLPRFASRPAGFADTLPVRPPDLPDAQDLVPASPLEAAGPRRCLRRAACPWPRAKTSSRRRAGSRTACPRWRHPTGTSR